MEFGSRGTEQDLQLDEQFLEGNPEDKVQTSLAPRRRTVARAADGADSTVPSGEAAEAPRLVRPASRNKKAVFIFCGICIDVDEQGHI